MKSEKYETLCLMIIKDRVLCTDVVFLQHAQINPLINYGINIKVIIKFPLNLGFREVVSDTGHMSA